MQTWRKEQRIYWGQILSKNYSCCWNSNPKPASIPDLSLALVWGAAAGQLLGCSSCLFFQVLPMAPWLLGLCFVVTWGTQGSALPSITMQSGVCLIRNLLLRCACRLAAERPGRLAPAALVCAKCQAQVLLNFWALGLLSWCRAGELGKSCCRSVALSSGEPL